MKMLKWIVAALFAPSLGAAAPICTQTLSAGTNVASALTSAAAGSTICLNAGNYGTVSLKNVQKNPRVILISLSAKSAVIALDLENGTNGFVFDSLTIGGGYIGGNSTKNITVQNSTFTDAVTFDELYNSNILFDHNTHNNIMADGQYTRPARLHFRTEVEAGFPASPSKIHF